MAITICDSCAPAFVAKVEQAIQAVPLLTCDATDCADCQGAMAGKSEPMVLAHYSRNGVENWKAFGMSNGLNWSEFVCDSVAAVDRMTEQPGRVYKQLCLIRFPHCKNLRMRQESFNRGYHAIHIAVHFAIPSAYIGRLTLAHSDGPPSMYTIV